jgi:uncharacterized protein
VVRFPRGVADEGPRLSSSNRSASALLSLSQAISRSGTLLVPSGMASTGGRGPTAEARYLQSAIIGTVDRSDETAGSLLRQARHGAGISQAELAFRASVAQSVISAYEAGRRQPSLPTLARLIDAAGCDLVVDIQQQPPQLSRLSGPVGRQVRRKRRDLVAAAAAHEVTNLRVFGSVARGEDRPDSDVDLLVDLPPHLGLLGLGRVQAELEAILGAKIDLVPASDLKPAVRARAERDLVAL